MKRVKVKDQTVTQPEMVYENKMLKTKDRKCPYCQSCDVVGITFGNINREIISRCMKCEKLFILDKDFICEH